jgi:hypothetical protein
MYMTLTSVVYVYMLTLSNLSSAKTRIFMLPHVLLLLVIAHNYFYIFFVFYSRQLIISTFQILVTETNNNKLKMMLK